jgi:hypothetical protein
MVASKNATAAATTAALPIAAADRVTSGFGLAAVAAGALAVALF